MVLDIQPSAISAKLMKNLGGLRSVHPMLGDMQDRVEQIQIHHADVAALLGQAVLEFACTALRLSPSTKCRASVSMATTPSREFEPRRRQFKYCRRRLKTAGDMHETRELQDH